jgi:sugar O-acyltransferase (sialic acid O-acetyltransferase NeuD family)
MVERLMFWGAKGQAVVLKPIAEAQGYQLDLVYDRDSTVTGPFPGIQCAHEEAEIDDWLSKSQDDAHSFAVAIGGVHGKERLALHAKLAAKGLAPATLRHATAWVAETAELGAGCQILAMSAVGERAQLGEQCIVNTRAGIDHECRLGAGVHVMPGATLAGCVEVGDCVMIGSGAVVLPYLKIGAHAKIGAGAVVTHDVPEGTTVVGNPARALSERET